MLQNNDTAILGVGIDLCDVARIEKLLERYSESFTQKNFTPAEIAYCASKANPAIHYAGRFAAKEAMAKALGSGFRENISLLSLSVENDELGCPKAILDEAAKNLMKKIGAQKIFVSISHIKDYAQAIAILSK